MKRVFTGSLAAASVSASLAMASGMLFLFRLDIGDGVTNGRNLLGVLIGNFQFERFFEGHYQFDDIKRICAQIVDEGSLVVHLAFVYAELLVGVKMAEKMKAAGVPVTLEVWPKVFHVWQVMADMLPEGRASIDKIAAFMREQLGTRH